MIGQATAGRDQYFIEQPNITIDIGMVRAVAESQGYVSPEAAAALEGRIERTEIDLEALRNAHPDWGGEVDRAVAAYNEGNLDEARAIFERINEQVARRQAEMRADLARAKHAQAMLFYPFMSSKAAPLLCEAAELAVTNPWYWIECGHARIATGSLSGAKIAFETAERFAREEGNMREAAAALSGMGDVRLAAGERAMALEVYEESLEIARELTARDPGNADWARDVSVSLNKVGDVRLAEGERAAALEAYEEGLEIQRELAARDPGHAGWARGVSISLTKVGDVRLAEGERAAALEAYEEGLEIQRELAARDPGHAGWARDLWVSHWKLAGATDPSRSVAHWSEVVRIMEGLQAQGRLPPADALSLDPARANLAAARGEQAEPAPIR